MASNLFRSIRLNSFSSNSLNRSSASVGEVFYDSTNDTLRLFNTSSSSSLIATRNWVIQNSYVLVPATTSILGGVKVDGATITISNGVISATQPIPYSLPTATTGTLGGVKVDGATITITNGIISATQSTPYSLPTASNTVLGGVKVDGTSITITDGIISATLPTPYSLPTASDTVLGGVKVDGTSITITNGIISSSKNTWLDQTSSVTATNGQWIMCNSTATPISITLPATPSAGDSVKVNSGPKAANNNITILRNGSSIMSLSEDLIISNNNVTIEFVYIGSTWRIA